ncbi:NAD(P)H-dependent flavin oxidoreductase [Ilyomonas limi]|nr:nitronate monooxygenase [Ilyomonas limi]
MNWKNIITQQLNIEYPIIQAPMFGTATPEMVTAATSIGCLGALPLGDLPAEKCIEIIRATRQLSNRPFAVNIFANEIPVITEDIRTKYTQTKQFIEDLARQHHLIVTLPTIDELPLNGYQEQVDAIVAEECKVVSFTFGNLDEQSIQKLKSNGTILIGTCTSVKEATILEQSGIDILCVQGFEAGGHRGSFATADDNSPMIGGLALLAQVHEAVSIPIIYAGGIYNAKTLLAANTLGAQGFQIGSLLLGSAESALKAFEKEKLRHVKEEEIVLTKSFSGRYARGIKNAFIEAVDHTDYILPFPFQSKLTVELRKAAKANNNIDFVSIWMGQSIHPFSGLSTAEILKALIAATEKEYNR